MVLSIPSTEELIKLHLHTIAEHIRVKERRRLLDRTERRKFFEDRIASWMEQPLSKIAFVNNTKPKVFIDNNAMAQSIRNIMKGHPEWNCWVLDYPQVHRVYLVKQDEHS